MNARDGLAGLIESQQDFYELRAGDYLDEAVPDRKVCGNISSELARTIVDDLHLTGDVLELACGSGAWTRDLVRHADTVTAVDGSPRMLERNRAEVADDRVTYVLADLFDWQPEREYDAA